MKNSKLKYLIYVAIGVFTLISCENWIDPDLNVDPDSPLDPPMQVILPSAQGRIAYHTGSFDVTGTTSMWMQHIVGASRQAQIIGNYTFVSSDVANLWNSFYRDAMMDLTLVIEKSQAEATKSPYYEGIAKVMLAYDLGLATQLWGDIPYSEAWKGLENKHPAYDAQSDIYATIQTLLDEAITALNVDPADNIFDPSDGDMIFNGDLDAWIKTARALKARFAIHLSERNGNSAYQDAIDFIAAGAFESNDDDFQFNFGLGDTEANPLYQFDDQREDANPSTGFADFVNSVNNFTTEDPRLAIYQTNTEATGEKTFGSYFGAKDAPVHFMTYVEQLFILAEAYYHVGPEQSAKDNLEAAVSASLDKFGVSNAAWLAELSAKIAPLTGIALEQEILHQKYIAMFLQPEVFVDWRRRGYPDLTPVSGTQIPRRFPYSIEERNFNRNIPDVTSIYARNWFDVE